MTTDGHPTIEVEVGRTDLARAPRDTATLWGYDAVRSMMIGTTRALGALTRYSDVLRGNRVEVGVVGIGYQDPEGPAPDWKRSMSVRATADLKLGDLSFVMLASRSWTRSEATPWTDESMDAPVRLILSRDLNGERDGLVAHVDVSRRDGANSARVWTYVMDSLTSTNVLQYLERHVAFENAQRLKDVRER